VKEKFAEEKRRLYEQATERREAASAAEQTRAGYRNTYNLKRNASPGTQSAFGSDRGVQRGKSSRAVDIGGDRCARVLRGPADYYGVAPNSESGSTSLRPRTPTIGTLGAARAVSSPHGTLGSQDQGTKTPTLLPPRERADMQRRAAHYKHQMILG